MYSINSWTENEKKGFVFNYNAGSIVENEINFDSAAESLKVVYIYQRVVQQISVEKWAAASKLHLVVV